MGKPAPAIGPLLPASPTRIGRPLATQGDICMLQAQAPDGANQGRQLWEAAHVGFSHTASNSTDSDQLVRCCDGPRSGKRDRRRIDAVCWFQFSLSCVDQVLVERAETDRSFQDLVGKMLRFWKRSQNKPRPVVSCFVPSIALALGPGPWALGSGSGK